MNRKQLEIWYKLNNFSNHFQCERGKYTKGQRLSGYI